MAWLTPEKLARLIQILTVLIGLWTGSDATSGIKVLASQPSGIVGADVDDKMSITGNATISLLSLLTAANAKRLADWLTGTTGSPRIGAALLLADLGILYELRSRANSPEQRAAIRETAIDLTSNTLFPERDKAEQGAAK
jgi:hypothetical protein